MGLLDLLPIAAEYMSFGLASSENSTLIKLRVSILNEIKPCAVLTSNVSISNSIVLGHHLCTVGTCAGLSCQRPNITPRS